MKTHTRRCAITSTSMAALLLSTLPAAAHVAGTDGGFAAGFAHPFTGLDHLAAILGVGVLAAFRGRSAILSISGVFLAAMVIGAALVIAGFAIPGAELMIVLSLLAFGVLLGSGKRIGGLLVHSAVGFFALFHGVAHGSEMALSLAPGVYILSFTSASALLLGLGSMVVAPALRRIGNQRAAAVS